jgi:transcription antitermination factor NusG
MIVNGHDSRLESISVNKKSEIKFNNNWYVFYTSPRAEKVAFKELTQRGYEVFLPMRKTLRIWKNRQKKMVDEILFTSYIFVNIERIMIFEVLKTPKLISCVKFNKMPAFIKQKEIDNIKQIVETKFPFEVCGKLKIGDSVEITDGSLTGMKGILVEERGSQRFALRIESLQQSLLVNVPSDYLELAELRV